MLSYPPLASFPIPIPMPSLIRKTYSIIHENLPLLHPPRFLHPNRRNHIQFRNIQFLLRIHPPLLLQRREISRAFLGFRRRTFAFWFFGLGDPIALGFVACFAVADSRFIRRMFRLHGGSSRGSHCEVVNLVRGGCLRWLGWLFFCGR